MSDTEKVNETLRKGLELTRGLRLQAKLDGLIKPNEPVYGSMEFVTIARREYDIATTTELSFLGLGMTVEVIKPLAGLTNLEDLWLYDNQISDADKEWLKVQLPNCDISF